MDSQIGDPAVAGATGHHESADRRRHGDRSGSDGRGGPRYAFRAPVAVRPDDIAAAIAHYAALLVWRARNVKPHAPPRRVALSDIPLSPDTDYWAEHDRLTLRSLGFSSAAIAAANIPPSSHLSPSPDMAAPANVPTAPDVPTAPPADAAALRTPRAAHRRRSVSVAG